MADVRPQGAAHDAAMTTPYNRPPLRWMQIVGTFYVLQFVMMVLVRAPIRTFGPAGTLSEAAAGDPLARFVVDTWTIFGLEVGAVGVMLLIATRRSELAAGAIWTVLAIEVGRGLVADTYMIARGIDVAGYLVWIVIHSVVIVTGLMAVRAGRRVVDVPGAPAGQPL
jgi:hypothetical protein